MLYRGSTEFELFNLFGSVIEQEGGVAKKRLVIHELRFTALQFQDAKYRVPEPSPQYLHCGLWDGHFRLHPQPTLLLLPDSVTAPGTQRALCIQAGYSEGKGQRIKLA